jgi:hypothetical protein
MRGFRTLHLFPGRLHVAHTQRHLRQKQARVHVVGLRTQRALELDGSGAFVTGSDE